MSSDLAQAFGNVDHELRRLEGESQQGEPALAPTVDTAIVLVTRLLRAYVQDKVARGERPAPDAEPDDVLELFKVFVKGDPSLNAVRDNVRELVYYRNCLALKREDALPPRPAAMAIRTARHIYLYLRSRCLQEHRLETD